VNRPYSIDYARLEFEDFYKTIFLRLFTRPSRLLQDSPTSSPEYFGKGLGVKSTSKSVAPQEKM
jgi:hypothetical protein